MHFDLAKIKEMVGRRQDVNPYIDDVFAQSIEQSDPPLLSDVLLGYKHGGVHIMEALMEKYINDRDVPPENRFIWKLYHKRDEWGNEPFHGDIVLRRIQKVLNHRRFHPATSTDLSLDKIQGVYDEKWHRYIKYTVDEKGCISCEFQDASYFLNSFGIHPRSGKGGPPFSMHLIEHGKDSAKAPNGQMLHPWYHRFVEMDKASYAKLPKLPKRDKSVNPRRGIDPIVETSKQVAPSHA